MAVLLAEFNMSTKKLSVKLHAQVRFVIYKIMTADRKSLHTEKQQETTQLNIH